MKRIILASNSERRRELLSSVDVDFDVEPSDVEETVPDGIQPCEVPLYLAKLKARDVYKRHNDDIVIGSDTVVVVDDKVLNKPKDSCEAFDMLKMLSGRKHFVYTGCCVIANGEEMSFCEETEVEFFELSDREINEYIKTGECFDKAGAYGIQSLGKTLVKGICGDYYNVVGLPVAKLKRLLDRLI